MDPDTDDSIMIEILSMAKLAKISDSAVFHWNEIVLLNEAQGTEVIIDSETLNIKDWFPNLEIPANTKCNPEAHLIVGQFRASKFNENASNLVKIVLVLLRLQDQISDIVFTFNSAIEVNPNSSSSGLSSSSSSQNILALFKNIIGSFKIIDWALF